MLPLQDRYADRISATLTCYDRLILVGTLTSVSAEAGLADFLRRAEIPLTAFAAFGQRLRDRLEAHVEALAAREGLTIEYLRTTRGFSKEARVQEILAQRGDHPGLVHIFSVVEPGNSFRVLTNRRTTQPFLKPHLGAKCKHYYFYFIDPEFGLCYLRVPTWIPFRLQFYANGHSWLARQLTRAGISFTQCDNALTAFSDPVRAQQLAHDFPVQELHQALDQWAQQYCPVQTELGTTTYHWTIMQAELATDLVFHSPEALGAVYAALSRLAICVVKVEDVATFVGRPLAPAHVESARSRFQTQIQGTRIRHQYGPVSVKMYDKHGFSLRIETTVHDVSFFRLHREVAHQDGTRSLKLAPMKKTLYSLSVLQGTLTACNRRYLSFLTTLLDPTLGVERADRLGQSQRAGGRTYRGFNLFASADRELLEAIVRPEWSFRGFTNKMLRRVLPGRTGAQVSRLLKRLTLHGCLAPFTRSYRYRLTELGQQLVLTALKLRELVVIPSLAGL
jgi:hypothetical protein